MVKAKKRNIFDRHSSSLSGVSSCFYFKFYIELSLGIVRTFNCIHRLKCTYFENTALLRKNSFRELRTDDESGQT